LENQQKQIQAFLDSLPDLKREALTSLHSSIVSAFPHLELWFLDGRNAEGKIVTHPNIGYGRTKLPTKKVTYFYRLGLSATQSGISIYFMGLSDRNFLKNKYAALLPQVSITGYCMKMTSIMEENREVLKSAIFQHLLGEDKSGV
jgi:hypothetical protein